MLCTVTDFVRNISYRTLFLNLAEHHGAVFRGSCGLTEQNRPMDRSTTGIQTFLDLSSVSSIIMATIIVAWFATMTLTNPSVVVTWGPVVIAVSPPIVIPGAVFVSSASTPTIFMIVLTCIAGIIRAWVIVAFA